MDMKHSAELMHGEERIEHHNSPPNCPRPSWLPQEPGDVADGAGAPPPSWPHSGALRFDRVTATYRPGLPPVLRDISFELQVRSGGERTGEECVHSTDRVGGGKGDEGLSQPIASINEERMNFPDVADSPHDRAASRAASWGAPAAASRA